MPVGPFDEVEIINDIDHEDSIEYLLRVKSTSIKAAKVKARMWTRANNPFSTDIVSVLQVMDPSTGAVLEGGGPHTIDIENIPDEDIEIEGIAMRDTFDIQTIVRR